MGIMNEEELNEVAMQVILHAGDGRKYCCDAINALYEDREEEYLEKIEKAKKEITIAHNMQTEIIQKTVECMNQPITLLFIHAQDTLMTINSEIILSEHMYRLYKKLKKQ